MTQAHNALLTKEGKEQIAEKLTGVEDFQEFIRDCVEMVVNAVMSEEADMICGVPHGVKDPVNRQNSRNGYRDRPLNTTSGTVTLAIPKLRHGSYFPDCLIKRYKRSDRALWAAVAEMYLNGVSTRKIEKIAVELGVESMSSSTVSRITSELDEEVAAFRTRKLAGKYRYLWIDATYLKCRVSQKVTSVACVSAIALDSEGVRTVVGLEIMDAESYTGWKGFLEDLRERGLAGVELVISDAHAGLVRAVSEIFLKASWQRCFVHLMRNVSDKIAKKDDRKTVSKALTAVLKAETAKEATELYHEAIETAMTFSVAAGELLEEAEPDALCYLSFPKEHWIKIRTNNVQERANREIKRRTKVVSVFPSVASAMRLVGAFMAELDEDWMGRAYISPSTFADAEEGAEEFAPTGLAEGDGTEPVPPRGGTGSVPSPSARPVGEQKVDRKRKVA